MDLIGFLQILLWRWKLVVPMILLTLGGAFAVWTTVGPAYETSGSVLVLGPSLALDPDETDQLNPYLAYGNLAIPANVLSEIVLGDEVRRSIVANGGQPVYDVRLDSDRGPILVVHAEGSDAAVVETTVQLVMEELDTRFANLQRQAGAPETSFLTLSPVSLAGEAEELYSSRLRALFGVAVLGASLTIGLVLVAEASRRWRIRRRAEVLADVGSLAEEEDDRLKARITS